MYTASALQDLEIRFKRRGVAVSSLYDSLGIHRATWQRWRAGLFDPSAGDLVGIVKFARENGVPCSYSTLLPKPPPLKKPAKQD